MLFSFVLGVFATGAACSPLATLHGRQSSVPYGVVIRQCTTPGVVALTFDDGPFTFTEDLLNLLASNGVKATFFLNGQNKGRLADYPDLVRRMIAEGHQVGSHTWDHPYLSRLSDAQVTSEMTSLESAFMSIIGKIPTYMRPPYLDYSARTLQILGGLGYHVIDTSIDTLDWQYNTPATIGTSAQRFVDGLNAGGTITLMHDVHATTVYTLAANVIATLRSKGKTPVTVGECLGDAPGNWYRTTGTGGSVASPAVAGAVSPDLSCGGTNQYVCPGTNCCSQYGWCGTSADYCGAGCQKTFGSCT